MIDSFAIFTKCTITDDATSAFENAENINGAFTKGQSEISKLSSTTPPPTSYPKVTALPFAPLPS